MPRTVLIVDDSNTIRGFAKVFLKFLGVRSQEAEDGAQALEIVRADPPAVLKGPELQAVVKRFLGTAA